MNGFLFWGLSDGDREKIMSGFSAPAVLCHGDELYRTGFLGLIVSGTARVLRRNDSGEKIVMRTMECGDMFGAASVFGEWKEGSSSVVALTRCEVIYISETELRRIMEDYPQTAINYITFLSDRIRFLNRRMDVFSAGTAEQKLFEYLAGQSDTNGYVRLGFGMAELSRRLKIGRSSLYRALETLEAAGQIERDKNNFRIV